MKALERRLVWEKRTENELLRRRQHVQREGDFVLVSLALEPAQHGGWVKHCGEKKGGGRGQEDDGCEGSCVNHREAALGTYKRSAEILGSEGAARGGFGMA